MTCNSEKRKAFAEELVDNITQLAKKHGLEDLVIHRDHNPLMIAVRGCLGEKDGEKEYIELAVQLSEDLQQAESLNLTGARMVTEATANVGKAFDLSHMVAHESAAAAAPPARNDNDKDKCP